jgi:PKD repeat protein
MTSTQQNPNHTYSAAGTYTVSLRVTGPGGSDTETKENYIIVTPPPPVACFNTSQRNGKAPYTVNFTDTSTGVITSWLWNFADGMTSTQQNPNHTYSAAGTYTVSLRVTGPGGSDIETKRDYITVTANAPSSIRSTYYFIPNRRRIYITPHYLYRYIADWLWNFWNR